MTDPNPLGTTCPTCGASGRQDCTRIGGRHHKSRLLLMIQKSKPATPGENREEQNHHG